MNAEHISTADVLRANPGLTIWHLEHWMSRGLVPGQPRALGKGRTRSFTVAQARHIHTMQRLVEAGFPPETASRLAGDADGNRKVSTWLAPGIHVLVVPPPTETGTPL